MSIAHVSTRGQAVCLSSALIQPIAAADVAAALADVVSQEPLNDTCEVAGPHAFRLDDLIRRVLQANKDAREVVTDVDAPYFGTRLTDRSLTPGEKPRTGKTSLETWLATEPDAR